MQMHNTRPRRIPHYYIQAQFRICWVFVYISILGGFVPTTLAIGQVSERLIVKGYQDGLQLAKEIAPRIPVYAMAGSGILLTSMRFDKPVLTEIQQGYGGAWAKYLDWANELGGPRAVIPVVSVFGVSLLTGGERFREAAFTSLESWLFTGLLTYGLKETFGRVRPEDGADAIHFQPFSGNSSFPSGHTSSAFAIITPWVLYYPNPLTYGLFAISASTAIARVARDKHWPTDVVAGAAIGYFVGRRLARIHQQEGGTPKVSFSSMVAPNALLIVVNW